MKKVKKDIPMMPGRRYSSRRQPTSRSHRISAIVGGILLGLAAIWLVVLLMTNHSGRGTSFLFPIPGLAPPPVAQVPPLVAAGITLGHADQTPALNQQQALLIARQLEPDAATNAKKVGAQYILLNYIPPGTPGAHPSISNTPAWLILYQSIPSAPNDTSADPTPSSNSSHDLYIFLDANSGKELLKVWV